MKTMTQEKLIEGSGPVVAAKNIRKELKANFPGVNFSVRTKCYSMGNHIDVDYTDGPSRKKVEAITDRYIGGSFDGMTDCYNYEKSAFTSRFGSGKYINVNRGFSDKTLEMVLILVKSYKWNKPSDSMTVEDYKKGNASVWTSPNGIHSDGQQAFHRILSGLGDMI